MALSKRELLRSLVGQDVHLVLQGDGASYGILVGAAQDSLGAPETITAMGDDIIETHGRSYKKRYLGIDYISTIIYC